MAFVVEDGYGRKNANSYVTVAFARNYNEERGRTEFDDLTDTKLRQLLLRGTDYIEQRWGRYFTNERKRCHQGLSWPQLRAYDIFGNILEGVPQQVQVATVMLAQRGVEQDRLMIDPPSPFPKTDADGNTVLTNSGEIHSETKTVEGISKTTTFAHTGLKSKVVIGSVVIGGITSQEFPEVQRTIYPILGQSNQGLNVIRN
jgi:hypothetical protein